MTDRHDNRRSLMPIEQTLPAALPEQAGGSILQRMARGALDIARQEPRAAGSKRYRLDEQELCEPDYRQVLLWAERLGMAPEEVIARLSVAKAEIGEQEILELRIVESRIRTLVWDVDELPIDAFEWMPDLAVETLAVKALGYKTRMPGWSPNQHLPSLKRLDVAVCSLTSLDLSPVPGLTELDCSGNPLTELDLSPVPGLIKLQCWDTGLPELDLSPVPKLIELNCAWCQLVVLDLKPVPNLIRLDCFDNQLTNLNLQPVPGLVSLDCRRNPLTELDLSSLPNLVDFEADDHVKIKR